MCSAVELATAHGIEQRHAVDEFVAAAREDAAFGNAIHRVVGAADALQKDRDAARRAELADELDVTDVDAELERGGRHHHLELACLETLLGIEAGFLGEAAVMGRYVLLAQALGEMAGHALDHAPRVGEHQRGVVFFDEARELVIDRAPHLAGHHRLERRRWHHEVDVAIAHVTRVHDDGVVPRQGCRGEHPGFTGEVRGRSACCPAFPCPAPTTRLHFRPAVARPLRWASALRRGRCAEPAAWHWRPCAPA